MRFKPTIPRILNDYKKFMLRDISYQNSVNTLVTAKNPDIFFRKVENKDSQKNPILLFGCSFAYGDNLQDNQTLSYKLGTLTQRPIYNRALCSLGVQHMLFQLRHEEFYKIVPKPEYIIYVFIEGHVHRIYTPVSPSYNNGYTAFYKETKEGFQLKNRNFLTDKIIIQHHFSNLIANKYLKQMDFYNKHSENLLVKYIEESRKEAQKHWGNDIKFVILCYDTPRLENTLKSLEDSGFITITKDDFKIDVMDRKFRVSETDYHPSELAWDYIAPAIVEKLKL